MGRSQRQIRMRTRRLLAFATASATLVATPGSSPAASAPPTTPASTTDTAPAADGALPFGLERCDLELLAADPSYYRDEPVYVGNEMPTDEVRAWAAAQPAYEDIWIDRERNGWLSVGFSAGTAERQADLEREFPGVGVVAVAVEHGSAALDAVFQEAFAIATAAGLPAGGGVSVPHGRASVYVGVLDAPTLELFAAFAGRPVCFEGVDPADVIPDGPQPTAGDGWRLLGSERSGEAYRTGVATDDDQYAALWATAGITGDRPAVDFGSEIVVWFGAVYGSSCPIRMDDVVVDRKAALVHGTFVVPGANLACTDDANPEAYVVAIGRDRLPDGPFAVQLGPNDPPRGVPEERTLVAVGLSEPGSTARDDQIGPDPSLLDRTSEGSVVAAGGYIETDLRGVFRYRLDLTCPFHTIGPINAVTWIAATTGLVEAPPPAWLDAADGSGSLVVDLLLEAADADRGPQLTLSAGGHAERYVPAPAGTTSECP
jgi:hypothetical protein